MVSILLAGMMLAEDVKPKIVAASLFKNGYAVVLRELPVTGASTTIVDYPSPSLGTLWIGTSAGLTLKEVRMTDRERQTEEPAGSLAEFLRLNKGKQAELTLRTAAGEKTVAGQIVDVVHEVVYVRSGQTLALRVADVVSAQIQGEAAIVRKGTQRQRYLHLGTQGTGKVYFVGLEWGMTWAPGYTIDISDPKKLTFFAKSTVLNDLADFEGADLKFVTGFPNVPWAALKEPLLSGEDLSAFLARLQQMGIPTGGFAGRRDAQVMYNQAPAAGGDAFAPMQITGEGGEMSEDLFFYRQPNVSLKKGDRAYFLLLQAESEYEHLYTLDLPNTINENEGYNPQPQREVPYDVWHTIKFKNTSKQPLTTGPGTVFKDQQVMGQDTVLYTSAGGEVNVKMSKALDIRNDVNEEEIARERGALRTPSYGTFDLVTVKGTIALQSYKKEPARLRISKLFTGELVAADGNPKAAKLAKGLREVNAKTRLEWILTLDPAKAATLTYTYKVYVRV